tara:strand:- start:5011 stop:5790 length:780 start_codon:yes stop_codon:yes gene_type:complete
MQNFGQINETFKNILVDSIITKDEKGKKVFKGYVKALKENSTLKTQYNIFSKLENKVNEESEDERNEMFITECISLLENVGSDTIVKVNNNLVKYLTKNGYELYAGDYEFKSLHEHITNTAYLERNTKNVNAVIESKLFLKNYSKVLVESEEVEVEPYSNKMLIPLLEKKFNDKYANISELEKKVIRLSINGTDEAKEELYNSTIRECIDLVDVQLIKCTIEQKNTLLQVKDKLLRSKFSTDGFTSEMSKISYLKTTLN